MTLHHKIETMSEDGYNGYLIPLWNATTDAWRPDQVYLTVCAAHSRKGPHLHKKRAGRFTCIKGNVKIVVQEADGYTVFYSGDTHHYATIDVPAGKAAMIVALGDEEAWVLNMPSPAWQKDDQDEWPVEGWSYDG